MDDFFEAKKQPGNVDVSCCDDSLEKVRIDIEEISKRFSEKEKKEDIDYYFKKFETPAPYYLENPGLVIYSVMSRVDELMKNDASHGVMEKFNRINSMYRPMFIYSKIIRRELEPYFKNIEKILIDRL